MDWPAGAHRGRYVGGGSLTHGGESRKVGTLRGKLSSTPRLLSKFATPTSSWQGDVVNNNSADWILRIDKVMEVTGLGRSTIYLFISQGKFPKQVRLGVRAVGWSAKAVFQWLAEREVVI